MRRRPVLGPLRAAPLFVAAVALLLSACGTDTPEGVRVRLLTPPGSGGIQSPVYLVAPRTSRTEEPQRFRLEPVPGGESGLMVAPGAPDGMYNVLVEGPWRMLLPTRSAPTLSGKGSPAEIPMGPGLCVFVGARDQAKGAVGPDWSVERERLDGSYEPVPVKVTPAFFETTCIRLPREEWRGRVRVTGRMADGTPVRPVPLNLDTSDPDHAQLRLVMAAPQMPIAALTIGFGGEPSPRMRVELLGSGLRETYESAVSNHAAQVSAVPDLAASVRISLPGGDSESTFDVQDREREGLAFLVLLDLGVGASEARWVPLVLPEGVLASRVLVRPHTATAFARAPIRRTSSGDYEVRTLQKPQTWWVHTRDGAWIKQKLDTLPERVDLTGQTPVPGARLRGQLRETASGTRPLESGGWHVVAELHDGEDRLVLDRAAASLTGDATYSLELPPGTWTVRALGPGDPPRSGPPVEIKLSPGVRRGQPLSAR